MPPPDPDLDHCTVFCKFNLIYQRSSTFKRHIWLYDRGDYDALRTGLRNLSLEEVEEVDIDSAVETLTEKLKSEMLKHIPNKMVIIRPKDKPWMNAHLRHLLRSCHRFHKKAKRTQSEQDIVLHRAKRQEFKIAKKLVIALYNIKQSDKLTNALSNSKSFWTQMKNITHAKKKQINIPPLLENNEIVSENRDKANILNSHFAKQSCIEVPLNHSLPTLTYRTESRLLTVQTNAEEITKILKLLNVKKANGPDGISNFVLKAAASEIASPLSNIFNRSFTEGYFPVAWKSAHVQPLFKSKDRQDKKNYRPISLLSCVSKAQERIVYKRLYEYCQENNLLNEKNSGFRQNDSAINRLLYITHTIYKGLDEGKDTCIVFLDISKAFDRVWHEGLIFKLKRIGVGGNLLEWIKSYLSNRRQRVVIGGATSEWKYLEAGVPQGSILGPLLFLIYISDITDNISSNMNLFADDSCLMETFTDITAAFTKLNNDLAKLTTWAAQWLVIFSEPKTVYMLVSNRNREAFRNHPDLYLNNITLIEVDTHNNLGVTFSNDMSWKPHIEKIVSKASSALGVIQRAGPILSRSVREQLYKSMVLPIMDYGDVIYDNAPLYIKEKLNSLHRRAALMCTRAYRHTESNRLLQELGWCSLESRRQIHRLNLFYKIKNNLAQPYLSSLCPPLVGERAERYNLRNRADVTSTAWRTTEASNSFFPKTVANWNALSPSLKNLGTLKQFKAQVKAFFKIQVPHQFVRCDGYPAVLHTRLRLGLSALNDHRFSYNLIENRYCPNCPRKIENNMHFFLDCPQYAAQRQILMQSISGVLTDYITFGKRHKINIVLTGSQNINNETNSKLQTIVECYITDTHRFNINTT